MGEKFSKCRRVWPVVSLLAVVLLAGCQRGAKIVSVRGKVLYNGQPLEFGSVMFQPDNGLLARGTIQSDGTFELTTQTRRAAQNGCAVGRCQVRVTCFESQHPRAVQAAAAQGELPTGGLLVPKRYTSFGTNDLEVDVRSGAGPYVVQLADDPAGESVESS